MSGRNKQTLFDISRRGTLLFNEPLAPVTSFKIGGPAEFLLIPACIQDVQNAVKFARDNNYPCRVIGSGTNILVPDEGLPGLTIKLWHNFDKIKITGTTIDTQAGAAMLAVALAAGKAGLSDMEWCCGIPGTVGGAVFMNAGVKKEEISDILTSATVLTPEGDVIEVDNNHLEFGYRKSRLQKEKWIVLEASFELTEGNPQTIFSKMNELLEMRNKTQPIDLPNCGSVFRNPQGSFAGKLIAESGLKGYQVGGVKISEQHANFIVNINNGSATEVRELVELVKEKVLQDSGFELELELIIMK